MKKLAIWAALLFIPAVCSTVFAEKVNYPRAFAPEEGLVSSYEKPSREEICLNGSWNFQGDKDTGAPGDAIPQLSDWDKVPIKIPSPWNVNSFSMDRDMPGGDFRAYPSYPREWESLQAAWMRKTFTVPKKWDGKRFVLHFGAVAGDMVVYVDGKKAGEGFDIFFAQEFDVTDLVSAGGENQILVKIISPKLFDKRGRYGRREYLSGSFWGTHIAGIWQDVFLIAEPRVAITDVFVQSLVDQNELLVEATVENRGAVATTVAAAGSVREWINLTGKSVEEMPEVKWKLSDKDLLKLSSAPVTLGPGEVRKISLKVAVNGNLKPWTPDAPNLCGLLLSLSVNGKETDVKYQRFGWRQFTFKGNEMLLNGKPIVLRGDSWHFMGVPQMTRRYAYGWYRLLKDAGANAVRLHASVYPTFYHDLADEMGIMILDESAIWVSDGGPKADGDLFWTNCRTHVAELVRRDRNHPSVFGWSVCNEILPVLRNVWHSPQNMVDHCLDEIAVWRDICHTNDPTRDWISGDGEFDASGRLPTISIHYGGQEEMRKAATSGKPWGVGETSMAYYGTPKQVSKFNGDRAYESPLGRMEGLAYECYGLLRDQQKFGADYQSVFNIVWYGVQPLPFGKSDLAHAPSLDEGIFFGEFREGVPGMQLERLGPYVSTLNPGYDPALPLYRPWPMFEAIRDANRGITNSPWATLPNLTTQTSATSSLTKGTAMLVYVPENGNALAQKLSKSGVKTAEYSADAKANDLLIDGSAESKPATVEMLKTATARVLGEGGTVWIWDVRPVGAAMLTMVLGQDVSVHPRVASSFVIKHKDALVNGLDNAALYFAESDDWQQMAYALDGEFVKDGEVLIDACPGDWRKWNYKSEQTKTASLFRSEVENPGSLAAVVVRPMKKGRVILCNLDPAIGSQKKSTIVQQLFRNAGLQVADSRYENGFLDSNGHLRRALVCGGFETANPYSGKMPKEPIQENASLENRRWKIRETDGSGVFDFKSGIVEGNLENSVAYLAFWIKSPKPLNDLLSEPNLPKLSFTYGSDDGCELFLNGELIASHRREGPLEPEAFSENPLLLKLGWNQIVIKVVQIGGEWKFAGKFSCSDENFLQKLDFAAEKPVAQ